VVVARLLLENGADVNVQSRDYGNALLAASYNGHEAIVTAQSIVER
jgi:ankyrin repeat protein